MRWWFTVVVKLNFLVFDSFFNISYIRVLFPISVMFLSYIRCNVF